MLLSENELAGAYEADGVSYSSSQDQVHYLYSRVDGQLRGAPDHDPVFGAMVLLLQRQPPARLDHDALDLVTFTIVDRLIAAPDAPQ